MRNILTTVLFAAVAAIGCGDSSGGGAGAGGSAGTGGSAGAGGGAGTGGTAGAGGMGGAGGSGGAIPGTEYAQDFESLDSASAAALSVDPNPLWGDGWLVFGNVYNPDTSVFGSYGPFVAPNSTAATTPDAFSAVASGEGGATQGAQQLSIFNDYQNANHTNGSGRTIESIVYRERPIVAGDEGKTLTFSFDAKRGNIGGATTAMAFIKTLDPDAGFMQTNLVPQDTTNIPADWMRYPIELPIDAGLVGQIVQFGFSSTASNSEPSGVLYDNTLVVVD